MKRRSRIGQVAPNAVLAVALLIVLVPFLWVIMASLRQGDVLTGGFFDLSNISLDSYRRVIETGLPRDFLNSIIACGVASLLAVGVSVVAAYAFSRFTFKGSKNLFWLLVIVQLVPPVSMVVPLYKFWAVLHLFNSLLGLGIAYAGINTAVCLLLLKGFIDEIPRELGEAAAIDGCSEWSTFRRIILPLLGPGLTSSGIYVLVITWQEFVISSSLMNDANHFTLTVGLENLIGQNTSDYGAIMAGSVLTALPIIIVFGIFQKQFVQSVTGGVKA